MIQATAYHSVLHDARELGVHGESDGCASSVAVRCAEFVTDISEEGERQATLLLFINKTQVRDAIIHLAVEYEAANVNHSVRSDSQASKLRGVTPTANARACKAV